MADLATEAFFRFGDDQALHDMQNLSTGGNYQAQSIQNSYIVRSPAVTGSNQGSFLGTPISQGCVFSLRYVCLLNQLNISNSVYKY